MTWRLVDRWAVADASRWPAHGFTVRGPSLRLGDEDLLVVRVADASGRSRHTPFRRVTELADTRAVSGIELRVCPDWAFPVSVRLLHGGGAGARSTI